jgi:hypothetical protein
MTTTDACSCTEYVLGVSLVLVKRKRSDALSDPGRVPLFAGEEPVELSARLCTGRSHQNEGVCVRDLSAMGVAAAPCSCVRNTSARTPPQQPDPPSSWGVRSELGN